MADHTVDAQLGNNSEACTSHVRWGLVGKCATGAGESLAADEAAVAGLADHMVDAQLGNNSVLGLCSITFFGSPGAPWCSGQCHYLLAVVG